MDTVGISTGKSVTNARIKNQTGDWKTLVAKLLKFTVTDETYEEYMAMPIDQQSRIKNVGYFIGGQFEGNTRDKNKLRHRSMVTLDLDFLPGRYFFEIALSYHKLEYVLHSTHKHSSENPRYRLVFRLSRNVSPSEYQPIARYLADLLGIEYFDHTAFRVTQLMYWPSRSIDGEEVAVYHEGEVADVDEILASYDDWEDFGEWPRSERETKLHSSGMSVAEDPYEKTGIIGVFCRKFDIHQAIAQFDLPYEPTDWENRYLPTGSSGASGAVVYPSELCEAAFMFSHHESDPAGSQNCNSWDLVRLHKFGELDTEEEYSSPSQMPSFKAMTNFALNIAEVMEGAASEEFSDGLGKSLDSVASVAPEVIAIEYAALEAELTDAKFNRDQRKSFILKLASARLSPTDEDVLIGLLQKASGAGKIALRKELKAVKQSIVHSDEDRAATDVELKVLKIILAEFNAGMHIKRTGKQWWAYHQGLWSRREDEFVQGVVQDLLFDYKEDMTDAPADVYEYFSSTKISTISPAMYGLLNAHTAAKETSLDPLQLTRRIAVPRINCLNCEIHFDRAGDFELRDHDLNNFYTTQLNVNYDPDALCPEWDRFVNMIFQNTIDPEDNIRHLEEVMGYIIQMSRSRKSFVLFKGSTDTGKTTVAAVLERMLGSAVMSTDMSKFDGGTFVESNLVNKQLILDDDFKKGVQLPDGFIKKTSEEKMITADVKYALPLTFISRAMPMILTNYWPMTRDVTDAFRERALVFEFQHRIKGKEKSDERRDTMLNDELSGILNRLIRGIGRMHVRQAWKPTVDNNLAHARWVDHANPVSMFLSETMHASVGDTVRRSEVWQKYVGWFKSSNPSGRASSKSEFYERMEALIGRSTRRNGIEVYTDYTFTVAETAEEFSDERD